MKSSDIASFFATLQAANPQPVTELEYTSVFELLVAVLLSAQATDVGVNKATRRLFAVANSPQKILALGLEGLEGLANLVLLEGLEDLECLVLQELQELQELQVLQVLQEFLELLEYLCLLLILGLLSILVNYLLYHLYHPYS